MLTRSAFKDEASVYHRYFSEFNFSLPHFAMRLMYFGDYRMDGRSRSGAISESILEEGNV